MPPITPCEQIHEAHGPEAHRTEIFERILNRSPGILIVLRREDGWPIESVSENVARLGHDARTLINDATRFLDLVHDDDRDRIEMEADYWSEQSGREEFRLEFRCRTVEDDVHWLDTHLWVLRDDGGVVRRMQGIAWDITERKRAERLQRLAVQVVELLNCPDEAQEVGRNILELARFYTGIGSAAIHLLDDGSAPRCIASGFGSDESIDVNRSALTQEILRGASRRGRDRHRSSTDETPRHDDDWNRTDVGTVWSARGTDASMLADLGPDRSGRPLASAGSFALIPMKVGGQVVGLLELRDDRRGQLDGETIEALEGVGFSMGIALDRERATRHLSRSEERYRALFDTSSDGIAMLSLDHRIEAANVALEGLTGRKPEDLEEAGLWAILHPFSDPDTTACIPGQLLRDDFSEDVEGEVIRPDGTKTSVVMRAWTVRDDGGRPKRTLMILRDIERQRRAEREVTRLVTAIEQSAEMMIVTDVDGRIEYVNPTFVEVTGYTREDADGLSMLALRDPGRSASSYDDLRDHVRGGGVFKGRIAQQKKDGTVYHVDQTISPVRDDTGNIVNFVVVQRDVTEMMWLESQLLQAQKLESIGRLAAGIAHEINTPSQYVGDNVRFLKDAFEDFMKVMDVGARLTETAIARGLLPRECARVKDVVAEIDLEFLAEEIPRAIDQSIGGLSHVSHIVGAMKYFSHPGSDDISPVDIHQAIRSTVTVARNEWKYDVDLELDLADDVPPVPCQANEFNQVILNLVINATHAIQAKRDADDPKGQIVLRTRVEDGHAVIEVEDTGTGIEDDVRAMIFDPFFTTKDVGSGTGQGLAIAREVIVAHHGGRIDFRSTPGVGTTFEIRLPLAHGGHVERGPSRCDA